MTSEPHQQMELPLLLDMEIKELRRELDRYAYMQQSHEHCNREIDYLRNEVRYLREQLAEQAKWQSNPRWGYIRPGDIKPPGERW